MRPVQRSRERPGRRRNRTAYSFDVLTFQVTVWALEVLVP